VLRLVDLTLPTPEENLALDEALLLGLEEAASWGRAQEAETIRFWESPSYFVVLGVSRPLQVDVDLEACRHAAVPVLRRSSGGGTVLQGPGCLNFTLVLSLEGRPELRDVRRSFNLLLARVANGLALDTTLRGLSDLALADRKISGNAQKRTSRALLHHGTILHALEGVQVARFLREPAERPDYRGERNHQAFLGNVPLSRDEIKTRLALAWGAAAPEAGFQTPQLSRLLGEKYRNRQWLERF
jgi:lipoate-protein ligase A